MAERDEESVAVCNTDGRTEDHSLCPRGLRAPEPTGGEREEKKELYNACTRTMVRMGNLPSMLDFGQFDFGQLAEVEIGRSRNWPKSKLAEVEIGRSRTDGVCSVSSFSLSFPLSFFFSFFFFFFFSFSFFLLSHHTLHFLFVLLLLLSPPGLHTTARELQTCTFQGRRFKHHPNSTKGPQREGEKKENCGGRGQKKREILGTHPSVHHPFGAPPFRGPTLRGPTFSGFGLPPFGAPGPWWSQNSTSKN